MQVANTIEYYRKRLDEAVVQANKSIEDQAQWINPWEAMPEPTLGKWRVTDKTDSYIRIEVPEVPGGSVFGHHFHKCRERITILHGGMIVRYRNGDWIAKSVIRGQSIDIPAGYLHHMYWEADTSMVIEYFK